MGTQRIFYFDHNTSNSISNITITGGIQGNIITGGGGMRLYYSNPILNNVTIKNNTSMTGGGLYLWSSDPILNNVTINENTASSNAGGIYMYLSNPILNNVVFSENIANIGTQKKIYINYPF